MRHRLIISERAFSFLKINDSEYYYRQSDYKGGKRRIGNVIWAEIYDGTCHTPSWVEFYCLVEKKLGALLSMEWMEFGFFIARKLKRNPIFYREIFDGLQLLVDDPLNKLRLRAHQLGVWLKKYIEEVNNRVDCERHGLLSEAEVEELDRAYAAAQVVLGIFEQMVDLYCTVYTRQQLNLHGALPKFDIDLSQVGDAIRQLTALEELTLDEREEVEDAFRLKTSQIEVELQSVVFPRLTSGVS